MTADRDFRLLSEVPDAQQYIPVLAPWIREAGNPYFDAFFGGETEAVAALERWAARPSSELSLTRTIGLFEDGELAGIVVALGAPELAACIKADMLAALRDAGRAGRADLLQRAAGLSGLRPALEPDVFYLSKMTVAPRMRGGGRGRALFREGIAAGRRAGYRRFRCEARATDAVNVRLYESEGFNIVERTSCPLGQELYVMTLEE
ncbi:MAG TPA: GNAT family N-acetyltransferase [Solirubrobacteraceae bacterium]|nr:GNAT family N-acetyltransferase [Solirubrobacteraceae bacterium]